MAHVVLPALVTDASWMYSAPRGTNFWWVVPSENEPPPDDGTVTMGSIGVELVAGMGYDWECAVDPADDRGTLAQGFLTVLSRSTARAGVVPSTAPPWEAEREDMARATRPREMPPPFTS